MNKYKLCSFLCLFLILMSMGAGCNKFTPRNKVSTQVNKTSTTSKSVTKVPVTPKTFQPTITPSPNVKSNEIADNIENKENKNNKDNNSVTLPLEVEADSKVNQSLCKEKEEVLFRFPIADSNKTASVCYSKNNQEYIVYRYGTQDKIELEYPEKQDEDSWSKFTYSYYMRGGGAENEGLDLNYLIFDNEDYEYKIYQEYSAEEDKTKVGIIVTNLKTGKTKDIEGTSESMEGSLVALRDNKKIKIENQ